MAMILGLMVLAVPLLLVLTGLLSLGWQEGPTS